MAEQMTIFDFPEYLPEERKKTLTWNEFHQHCEHDGWIKGATETESSMVMCGYANKTNARCWDDWIPCKEENCPLLKE